jgi:hypothetical protein
MLLLLFPRVVVASAMLVASSDVTAAAQLQGSGTLLAPSSITASEQEIDGGSLNGDSVVTAAPGITGSAALVGSAAASAAGQVAGASTVIAPATLNASEQEIDSGLLAGDSTTTSVPVIIGASTAHADSQISALAAVDPVTTLDGNSSVAAQSQVIAAAQLDASSLVSAAGANTVIPSPVVGSGGRNGDTWYSASSSDYWETFRGTVERPALEPIQASGTAVGGSDVIAVPCQIARAIVNAEARLYARPRLLVAISPVAGDSEVYARGVPTTPSMDELLILLEEAA